MVLEYGSRGSDVFEWEKRLQNFGYPVTPDRDPATAFFGEQTRKYTIQFQIDRGLEADGRVGPQTLGAVDVIPKSQPWKLLGEDWPFLQAACWKYLNRTDVRLIVVHTMEAPEKPGTAEGVAAWFAGKLGPPPEASAHLCADGDSAVRCVRPEHQAAAAPGANTIGYHIEHAGYASQGEVGWADDYSQKMLAISARDAAKQCLRFGVQVRRYSLADLADELRAYCDGEPSRGGGFCGHADINEVWRNWKMFRLPKPGTHVRAPKKAGDHVDPGNAFPWTGYLNRVAASMPV
jgi:hypothetical protein